MFLSKISIKRPIMTSMFLIVFIIFGLLAYFGLSLNLMPNIDIPFITVQTVYPGAGPKEIETQISERIEDAVSTIGKIKTISSYSMESVSFVVLEFEMGKDVDIANQEVKDKISSIVNELPTDAFDPVVEKFDIGGESVVDVVFTGSMTARELFSYADKNIKDRFAQIEGAGKVTLIGGEEREIQIKLDNRVVRQNILSIPQLAQIIGAENMDMPAGHFSKDDQEFSVRFEGELESVEQFENIDIPTVFGLKKLDQLAKVSDTGAEVRERTVYFNNLTKNRNDNIIIFNITESSDGNTVELAKGIKKVVKELQEELPPGASLSVISDKSLFIEASVEDTLTNIILGVILTGVVLLFFLHDFRSTLIVALSMPFAIISTFLLMKISGFTMNIMTLMGLSIAVGILVTNSVVVLENIFRHKEMGHSRIEAADKGTAEVTVAVIASTMTNIVVFLPIATMSSMVGQFFKEFALTVTYATIFSLIVSFTLTPMLASLILPEHDKKKHPIGRFLEKMFKSWERGYQYFIKGVLASKVRSFGVILFAIIMFFLTMYFVTPKVGFEFMPMLDQGDISIEVEMPMGYNLEETAGMVNDIENIVQKNDAVKHMLTTVGSFDGMNIGTNLAKISVKLVDVEERDATSNVVANDLIRDLSDITNAQIRVMAVSSGGGSGAAPVYFQLKGQDLEKLERYKENLVAEIKEIPGLVNFNTSSRAGKPEITLIPKRKKIADAGLNIQTLAFTLRSSVEGLVCTQYREQGEEYDVKIMLTDESVDSPEELENITVVSRNGIYRLGQLAEIKFTEGYSKILHKDKFKSIEFSGYIAPGYVLGDIVKKVEEVFAKTEFDPGYKVEWAGDAEMMKETGIDMLRTFIIAILLTYMLLAATLENLTQPLIILGTVPLALIGVFGGLYLTGKTMNTMSMMAIVMLLGIVVNNAILLLDYTNILRKKGMSVHDALVEACPTKLKPILMATIAIIFGMAPMALGIGSAGVEFRQPMGIVSIGGLVISTFLSLLVIPAIYHLTSKEKKTSTEMEEV